MNDQQPEAPAPPQRGQPRKQPLESRPAVPKPPRVPGTAEWSKGGRPTRERQKESRRVAIHRGLSDLSTRPLHLLHPPRLLYPGVGLADHVPGPRLRLAYPAVVQVDLVLAPPTLPPPPRRRGPGTPRKMLATPLGGKPGRPLAPALDLGPDHPIDRRSDNYPAPGAGYATSSSSEGGAIGYR
ncbi:hypothetical protein PG987_011773 [Apiospora arundinis]